MKRYIVSSRECSSNLSFDFSWNNDYNYVQVEEVAEDALAPFECAGFDFISMTDQYDGYDKMYDNVSQCNVTFIHSGSYNASKIEQLLDAGLRRLGIYLEGIDFQSID